MRLVPSTEVRCGWIERGYIDRHMRAYQAFQLFRSARAVVAAACLCVSGSCESSDEDAVGPDKASPPILTIVISPGSAALAPGDTIRFRASSNFQGDTVIAWQSFNTAVATVSVTGLVTAVAPGLANITATIAAAPALRGSVRVTVNQ